jgi:hypothetical protein
VVITRADRDRRAEPPLTAAGAAEYVSYSCDRRQLDKALHVIRETQAQVEELQSCLRSADARSAKRISSLEEENARLRLKIETALSGPPAALTTPQAAADVRAEEKRIREASAAQVREAEAGFVRKLLEVKATHERELAAEQAKTAAARAALAAAEERAMSAPSGGRVGATAPPLPLPSAPHPAPATRAHTKWADDSNAQHTRFDAVPAAGSAPALPAAPGR